VKKHEKENENFEEERL